MAYYLAVDEGIETGIHRIAVEVIEDIERHLTDGTFDRDTAVHESRKQFKRLRALLRLIRFAAGKELVKLEEAQLREAALRLAEARDSAVLLMTMDKLRDFYGEEMPAAIYQLIHAQLDAQYQQLRQRDQVDQGKFAPIVTQVAKSKVRIPTLSMPKNDFAPIAKGARRTYNRARKFAQRLSLDNDPDEAFHEWRKYVKYHYYQLEFLEQTCQPRINARVEKLKALSDLLGDDHDLAVLEDRIAASPHKFGGETTVHLMRSLIDARKRELKRLALQGGKPLFVQPPDDFAHYLTHCWQIWQTLDLPANLER